MYDNHAVEVACREMGYTDGGSQLDSGVLDFEIEDENFSPFWLDNIHCEGGEARLVDCRHNLWGDHNCLDHDTVNIRCDGAPVDGVLI